jgi:hypothetical protein
MPNERSPFDPTGFAAGAAGYQRKLFEMAQANTQLAFDYARDLMGVRSPDEALRITQDYMAKQTQAYQQQIKDLMEAVQQRTGSTWCARRSDVAHARLPPVSHVTARASAASQTAARGGRSSVRRLFCGDRSCVQQIVVSFIWTSKGRPGC